MKELDGDKLMRGYVRLSSLRDRLPEGHDVSETYALEYHEIVESLERMGFDLKEFKIPSDKIAPHVDRFQPPARFATQKPFSNSGFIETVSKERFVERAFFLLKIEAFIKYLDLLLKEEPRKIGFK